MTTRTLRSLDEIHLDVKDLARMRRFYTRTLGFRTAFHHPGRMAGLHTGGAMLVLEASPRKASGVGLSFSVRGIERVVAALRRKGVRLVLPLQDGHWGDRFAGFEDPEGNRIYLEEPIRGRGEGHHHH